MSALRLVAVVALAAVAAAVVAHTPVEVVQPAALADRGSSSIRIETLQPGGFAPPGFLMPCAYAFDVPNTRRKIVSTCLK